MRAGHLPAQVLLQRPELGPELRTQVVSLTFIRKILVGYIAPGYVLGALYESNGASEGVTAMLGIVAFR